MSGMGTNVRGGGDAKQMILNVMKEMSKTNSMVNKEDIWAVLQNQMDRKNFEGAVSRLNEDGTIYPVYGDDVFSVNQ